MSTAHIEAKKGEIAESILLPGDPLRAKYISEKFLNDVSCYNQIRGMLGFTGTYKGKRVSVQGTGMGMPSISIYVNELISEYGVKNLIRIGTCGSMHKDVKVRDVIIAMSASTNSAMNKIIFDGMDYAPSANFDLLMKAWKNAESKNIPTKVGNVLTSDSFYSDDPDGWKKWAEYGVLAGEMETSALYTLAAKFKVNALSLLTVSDSVVTGEETTPEERQLTFDQMIQIALDTV